MPDPRKIEAAIGRVHDQRSFIQDLLIDGLGWPVDEQAGDVEDITFEWTAEELRAAELDRHLVEGTVRQVRPFPGNPWGIFLLEFKRPEVFTATRGMMAPLRRVLRGLVPSKRKGSHLASFKRENLLFICSHKYEHYRFAYFKAPREDSQAAPLAAFGWGPGDAVRTVCEFNLDALAWPDTPPDDAGWVDLWARAFDVERVTKRFYEDYADVFVAAEKLIGKRKELEGDELRLFTQGLLNRLMFLRFIERKGWLTFPGQQARNYLAALMGAGPLGKQSFYQGRLRRLFFEGLAIEGKQESAVYGTVPFLNGGLFEESTLDRKVGDLPEETFRPIIGSDGLFYRYNFTVEESTPLDIEVAVDPEMLGKVFEELVTGRHETGSYYTPRAVVSFMCREALKGILEDKTAANAAAIEALVDRHDIERLRESSAREILEALDDLKAVDPACGSGAYLLGLLHEMVALYRVLYSEKLIRDPRSFYELKLRIISQNLYGVDIDPFATNIAMLRLWLSLAVEADHPVALPNLDFKIETGDSLQGPNPQEFQLLHQQLRFEADALVNVKRQYFLAQGEEKESYRRIIECGESRLRAALNADVGEGVVDWRIQFAEVFAYGRKGFDIVLANPPYVRQELIGDAKNPLGKQYDEGVEGKSDLYCYFYVRGLELLRQGGCHVFVCSNSWLDTGFGTKLQEYLLANAHPVAIYDSAVERQFATADINTLISIIRKGRPGARAQTRFVTLLGSFDISLRNPNMRRETAVPVTRLRSASRKNGETGRRRQGGGKWGRYLRAPVSYFTVTESQRPICTLGSELFWTFGRGRRTGADGFFYLPLDKQHEWNIEREFLAPLVKSPTEFMTIPPRTSALPGRWAIFLCRRPRSALRGTGALQYIEHGETQGVHHGNLVGASGNWYDLGDQPKADVILPIAFNDRFFVVLNDARAEVHQRFATLVLDTERKMYAKPLAAILSASALALMAEVLGRRALGQGALDFPPDDWRQVSIPDPSELSNSDLEALTAAWDSIATDPPVSFVSSSVTPARARLDELVGRLLGLDGGAIRTIRADAATLMRDRLAKSRSIGGFHVRT